MFVVKVIKSINTFGITLIELLLSLWIMIKVYIVYYLSNHYITNSQIDKVFILLYLIFVIEIVEDGLISLFYLFKYRNKVTYECDDKLKKIVGDFDVTIYCVDVNDFVIETLHLLYKDVIIISKNIVKEMKPNLLRLLLLHEIGHIKLNHYYRKFVLEISFLTILVLIYMKFNIEMLFLGSIIVVILMLNVSRQHEIEADTFAILNSGDTEGMKLLLMMTIDTEKPFSTHPDLSTRLKNIENLEKTIKNNVDKKEEIEDSSDFDITFLN